MLWIINRSIFKVRHVQIDELPRTSKSLVRILHVRHCVEWKFRMIFEEKFNEGLCLGGQFFVRVPYNIFLVKLIGRQVAYFSVSQTVQQILRTATYQSGQFSIHRKREVLKQISPGSTSSCQIWVCHLSLQKIRP